MRGYTWKKHRVWEIVQLSCPIEGVKKGFRGAAFIGHHSGKDQTPTRVSSKGLNIGVQNPQTQILSLFLSFDDKQEQINLKLAKLQPNRNFNAFDEQCLCEEDKSVSHKEDSRLVSRTSEQHLSVIWKTNISLQEKLWSKVWCIVPHFHLGGEKSRLLKKKSVKICLWNFLCGSKF